MSTVQCKAPIFLSCTHTSGSIQVVLVTAFVMVSTVWSVFVCCSSTHGALCAQPIVKVWGTCPPVPYGVGATAPSLPRVTELAFSKVALSLVFFHLRHTST